MTACGRETPRAASPDPAAMTRVDSGVTGVLKDAAGRPLANEQVLACMSKVCFTGRSGADGRFTFSIDPPAQLVIKTDSRLSSAPRRAGALVPVQLSGKSLVDVGDVHAPDLPDGIRLDAARAQPQTIQAGDGLELTLQRSVLTPRLGEIIVDVAARRLTPVQIPQYPGLDGEEVLAVYALHPFAVKSASPVAVKAPSGLPAGTAVKFRTIDEMDGRFSAPVPGRASGTFVSTDAGSGISELTYLVISK
jgi:hypothetical protein